MAVNPWEGVQQAAWAGRSMMKSGTQTGPLGEQVGKTGWQTRSTPQEAPKGGYKQPGAAQGPQFQASNALGRPNYGSQQTNQPQQQQNANTGGRRGAFGKGGGGAGGITIQNQFGDNAFGVGNVSGQNNVGGIGNIVGDNNTNNGNMGIGNFQAGGPAPTAGTSAPAPAGPSPTGPKPTGRGPKPIGGAPTPKGLPAGGNPTPVGAGPAAPTPVGSGPQPKAIGPGTGTTPTPAQPQGTKDVRTREQKIEDLANNPGATAGERAAAQQKLGGAPAPAEPTTPAISAPATQTPSAPAQAEQSTGLRQRRPVTGFDRRTLEPAGTGKIGPRKNMDGTIDDRQYTVGGQRLMPAGEDPNYGGVQPAAVQPNFNPQSTVEQASAGPAPAAQAEATKKQAKKKVGNAVKKGPQPVKNAQLKAAPRAKKKAKRS